jgi:protein arginine kinase activator
MSALLRKIHGSNQHVGVHDVELAGELGEEEARLFELRRELSEAVQLEEYERAAELRDAIQEIERTFVAAREVDEVVVEPREES